MNFLYLGAYWSDRAEQLDDCAERLHAFLVAVGRIDSIFDSWVSKRKGPVKEVSARSALDEVRALLGAGLNRRDFGGEVISELGYRADLWNGRTSDLEAVSITATCGLAAGNPNLSNAIVLRFPADLDYYSSSGVVRAAFDAAVQSWTPDWAWIGTNALRNSQGPQRPLVGLLTFVSDGQFLVDEEALPAEGIAVQRADGGTIFSISAADVPGLANRVARAITVR